MKINLLSALTGLAFLFIPSILFAQVPGFGSLHNFALFTSAGALGNTGVSEVVGNIGTDVGAITGFEAPTVVTGITYNADGVTAQAAADLQAAYDQLSAIPATNTTHTPTFGSGETLLPGVYSIAGAGSVAGDLTLDGQGNPNAIFIFKLAGAFTTGASSTIILSNGASACNIFWIAEGAISMATLTTMKGTLIAHPGAASMGASCNLEGRMFSTTGAVSIYGSSAVVPLACSANTLWTGAAGTSDWFTGGNWLGGVPNMALEAFIPGTLPLGRLFPVIDTGMATVDILRIQNEGSVIITATLQVHGAIVNNGVLDVNDGTIEMTGSLNQQIAANTFTGNSIKNLIVSNNVTLAGEDTITGSLSFGNVSNKTLNTGGLLTLKSTALGTANFRDITNAGNNSGNAILGHVKVERYIPANRSWRLLTSPTQATGGQTINEAWQEGADPGSPGDPDVDPGNGFGTHITGGLITDGFDQGVNANHGIKKMSNGAWVALSSTNTLISIEPGYMLFVRGDRGTILSQGTSAPATNTVLRSTGHLKTNDQVVATAPGLKLIGNPYASRVNFHTMDKGTAPDTYYIWDPKAAGNNGTGGYITFTWNGSSYSVSPIPLSDYDLNGGIESGSAFFVNNTAGNTITIKETDKNEGSANVFRPQGAPKQLRTNLYTYNADGNKALQDGTLFMYSGNYTNAVDKEDARKLANGSESLGIKNGSLLSIEKRNSITIADTLQFSMSSMKEKSYQLEFLAENLDLPGAMAFLEDSYLNTSTPIDLKNATIDFKVVNLPASKSPTRFRIVFKPLAVLPLSLISIKASRQNDDINVAWIAGNETGIKEYEVQQSADGRKFKSSRVLPATGNDHAVYNWLDEHPVNGNNYYRLRSVSTEGGERYSNTVNVSFENSRSAIVIYPNPVGSNRVNLQFKNMPAGIYRLKLINSLGQVSMAKEIMHGAGNSTETLQLNKHVARGVYSLTVFKPDHTLVSLKLFY